MSLWVTACVVDAALDSEVPGSEMVLIEEDSANDVDNGDGDEVALVAAVIVEMLVDTSEVTDGLTEDGVLEEVPPVISVPVMGIGVLIRLVNVRLLALLLLAGAPLLLEEADR